MNILSEGNCEGLTFLLFCLVFLVFFPVDTILKYGLQFTNTEDV